MPSPPSEHIPEPMASLHWSQLHQCPFSDKYLHVWICQHPQPKSKLMSHQCHIDVTCHFLCEQCACFFMLHNAKRFILDKQTLNIFLTLKIKHFFFTCGKYVLAIHERTRFLVWIKPNYSIILMVHEHTVSLRTQTVGMLSRINKKPRATNVTAYDTDT